MTFLVGLIVNDTTPAADYVRSGKTFTPGMRGSTQDGRTYVYVQASSAFALGDVVVFNQTFAASLTTTAANSPRGAKAGVAPCAFASGDYGWIQIDGICPAINVLPSAVANVRLNTTATAGKLDDDGTVGAKQIEGIYITTTNGGATASQPGVLTWPFVSVTL